MQGMHAYIVTGTSADEWIRKTLNAHAVSSHDTVTVVPDPISIGIETVRALIGRLVIHPVAGARHAVIIRQAHAVTPEAQNAFLKTLEEPPGDALIILETGSPDSLLPTVLSRCHLVRLAARIASNDDLLSCFKTLEQLTKSSVGERLQKIDALAKTRDEALAFVDLAITALHKDLPRHSEYAKLLRALLAARQHILGNITPKLALDAAFLYNK